jgi:hypothetical protein
MLFTSGSATGATGIAATLMKEESNPFKDGPEIITAMRKAAKSASSNHGKALSCGKKVK